MTKTEKQAKPARKLRVFQTQLGFYDIVVAAPSKAAALRAWGTHRDLFADDEARESTDARAITAAEAQPGVPLRRAVGTNDTFGLDPGLPRLPDLPRATAGRVPKPKPAPPDRSALKAAEGALEALIDQRRAEETQFKDRRASLDAEEAEAQRLFAAARSAAEKAAEREERAYIKAGGKKR